MKSLLIGLAALLSTSVLAAPASQDTVASLLSLSGKQLVQLEQLSDYVHAIRYEEEAKQNRDEAVSTARIRTAFESAQREAKGLLSPGQVYRLEQRMDQVRSAAPVQQRLLFVGTFDEFLSLPLDAEAARRWHESQKEYQRPNYRFAFGFGFCGRHHWCKPTCKPTPRSRAFGPRSAPRASGGAPSRAPGSIGGKR